MDEHKMLLAEAMLGQDAEDFLRSDVGRYLIGRADQEIQEAQQKLATVSPWRRRRIQELQAQIWRAQSVKGWLIEVINAGRSAEQALEEARMEN